MTFFYLDKTIFEFNCQSDEIDKPILAEIISWGPSGIVMKTDDPRIVLDYDRRLESYTMNHSL